MLFRSVLLIGGRHSDGYSSEVVSWSPTPVSGAVVMANHLARPVSDPGVAVVGTSVLVVGGEDNHESLSNISTISVGQ